MYIYLCVFVPSYKKNMYLFAKRNRKDKYLEIGCIFKNLFQKEGERERD